MRNIIFVRADFYNSGVIVPVGITYDDGHTEFIHTISRYERINKGEREEIHVFRCITNKGETRLVFDNTVWTIL